MPYKILITAYHCAKPDDIVQLIQIPKPRVALVIKEAIHLVKPNTASEPEDTPKLMEKHSLLSKQLHHLVHLLKHQQSSLDQHNDYRHRVMQHLVDMSVGTPISSILTTTTTNEDNDDDNKQQ